MRVVEQHCAQHRKSRASRHHAGYRTEIGSRWNNGGSICWRRSVHLTGSVACVNKVTLPHYFVRCNSPTAVSSRMLSARSCVVRSNSAQHRRSNRAQKCEHVELFRALIDLPITAPPHVARLGSRHTRRLRAVDIHEIKNKAKARRRIRAVGRRSCVSYNDPAQRRHKRPASTSYNPVHLRRQSSAGHRNQWRTPPSRCAVVTIPKPRRSDSRWSLSATISLIRTRRVSSTVRAIVAFLERGLSARLSRGERRVASFRTQIGARP